LGNKVVILFAQKVNPTHGRDSYENRIAWNQIDDSRSIFIRGSESEIHDLLCQNSTLSFSPSFSLGLERNLVANEPFQRFKLDARILHVFAVTR